MSKTECASCLCKIVPGICTQEKITSTPVNPDIQIPVQQRASEKLGDAILGGLM